MKKRKNMKIHTFQNDTEWLTWRRKGIGASDIAGIMLICPYNRPEDILRAKRGYDKPKNPAMERGIKFEDTARHLYNATQGASFEKAYISDEDHEWMIASLDGIDYSRGQILEIKVPGKKTLDDARNGKIPRHYFAQIQWQMLVAKNRFHAIYLCFDPKTLEIITIQIFPDLAYQEEMFQAAKAFYFDQMCTIYHNSSVLVHDEVVYLDSLKKELKDTSEEIKALGEHYNNVSKKYSDFYANKTYEKVEVTWTIRLKQDTL